jgi:fused signal recognition particle receptor
LHFDATAGGPNVWLFVGVNGVGKTTTIGKVAAQQAAGGRSVLMAAGDTFRAAAVEQLETWAQRSGAEIVRGNEGGDPSAVIFDAIERANARDVDLVLGDTAGRLHTKTNLMDELRKVRRVAAKGAGRVTEVLLVIDATTGQNGLAQAREFGAATMTDGVGVTGVVLTKLDGSAKGGIVFAIETELGFPVKLVGLGESLDDLVEFDPEEFIDALVKED